MTGVADPSSTCRPANPARTTDCCNHIESERVRQLVYGAARLYIPRTRREPRSRTDAAHGLMNDLGRSRRARGARCLGRPRLLPRLRSRGARPGGLARRPPMLRPALLPSRAAELVPQAGSKTRIIADPIAFAVAVPRMPSLGLSVVAMLDGQAWCVHFGLLNGVDRTLGLVFGLARGAVLVDRCLYSCRRHGTCRPRPLARGGAAGTDVIDGLWRRDLGGRADARQNISPRLYPHRRPVVRPVPPPCCFRLRLRATPCPAGLRKLPGPLPEPSAGDALMRSNELQTGVADASPLRRR